MNATELMQIARNGRPNVRYTTNRAETAVGAFCEPLNRWQAVAALGIDGKWRSMPMELLVNGKPAFEQADWIE